MIGRRQIGFATFLAVAAVGCSLLPAGRTAVTIPAREGVKELPVVLDDPGGLVTAVEAAPRDDSIDLPSLTVVGSDTVLLAWLGGACDARARLHVAAGPGSISIGVATDDAVGLGCTAVGIPRSVTIRFREPVGDRSVALDGGG